MKKLNRKIVLASKSERRKVLLEQLGIKFEVRESEYEEDMKARKNFKELAKFLALKKAEDVARHYFDAIIIAADSFIVYKGKFIGKPKNKKEAFEILKELSGKKNLAISGLAIIDTKNKIVLNDYGKALVKFRKLSDKEINDYIATGEPLKMAGAYGLMNKGSFLFESISGDFYSIIGLPIGKVYLGLKKLGIDIF